MGDPQAPFAKLREVLERHGALDDGVVADNVALISIGDHFDYDFRAPEQAGREGLALLRWLADHDAGSVTLLIGNHDISRVMELAGVTDEQFTAARTLARAVDDGSRTEAEFRAAFPALPPSGVVGRDYASFSIAQRDLVIELLLAGRFHLALAAVLPDGRDVLVTHAGVTSRELDLLGLADERDPRVIAAALEAQLHAAVERVRADWQRGVPTALTLAPIHLAGATGEEGGGLLYHRPSNPARRDANKAWELAPGRPRRFDPRTLPPGLTQVAGHSGHNKCLTELGDWATAAARGRLHGGIRTLRVLDGDVTYDLGIAPPADNAADLILIDGELRRVPASEVDLLELARVL
jgi:hypothetical protein